jgi:Na+-driven multidrug efflux pump
MLRMDRSIVRTLVRKGIPMGAQVLVVSLSGMLMIVLVNRFGVDTTAAFGASMQLWIYIQMPAFAIGMAVATMAALNVGGQKWDRVGSIARVGVIYSIVLTGSMVLVIYALDTYLYRLFLPAGSPALPIASHINAVVAWSFVFLGISIVLFGIVRAAGAVMVPLFVHTLTLLAVRFPLAALLMDRWQADAIWWSFPISSGLAVVLAALYYRYGGWRTASLNIPVAVKGVHSSSVGGS